MSKEMTAVEYLKAKARMINNCTIECEFCPLCACNNRYKISCMSFEIQHPEEAVAIVQKWAEEHPVKTRQSEFLKMFPNADCADGYVDICPKKIDFMLFSRFDCRKACRDCKKEYWLAEVE